MIEMFPPWVRWGTVHEREPAASPAPAPPRRRPPSGMTRLCYTCPPSRDVKTMQVSQGCTLFLHEKFVLVLVLVQVESVLLYYIKCETQTM